MRLFLFDPMGFSAVEALMAGNESELLGIINRNIA